MSSLHLMTLLGGCRMIRPLVPLPERDPEKPITLFSTSGIVRSLLASVF